MTAANQLPWLEILDGDAPLLLIAPHGGRAGVAARAALHPKVNDLETAAITKELAQRLHATALLNHGMDRNELDCNRLAQITEREPRLLDTIADHTAAMVAQYGRLTVLLIHGWNIIEPRVDFGLGLRERNGRLQPTRGAHITADDDFIQQVVSRLAGRLRRAGITPTFGLRYPGGDAQNLLQAFTPRHANHPNAAVRRLAELATGGAINALQLELSVAVRMAGAARRSMIDAVAATFDPPQPDAASHVPITIVRDLVARPKPKGATSGSNVPPFRIGVEFYDPVKRIGGMASFDFGPNAAGGRIMMLAEQRRVALFTGEGGALRVGQSVVLGPLALDGAPGHSGLRFRGVAVVVDDGTAYLSVEAALAGGRLDPAMEVDTELEFGADALPFGEVLDKLDAVIQQYPQSCDDGTPVLPRSSFGRLRGTVTFDGRRYPLDAIARAGVSFTGLGMRKFVERRMLWVALPGDPCRACELSAIEFDQTPPSHSAQVLTDDGWRDAQMETLDLVTSSPLEPPAQIAASITGSRTIRLQGTPDTFMTLSRPGPDGTRIHTSLGFARYQAGDQHGAGMYEYSRRVGGRSSAEDESPED